MLHAVSFVVDGQVATRVRVTGNLDGTLSFELTRLGGGSIVDLEAVFFDLNRPLDPGGFQVFGDAGLMLGTCVEAGVDTLGRPVTIKPATVDALGDFDIGLRFGSCRSRGSDPGAAQTTGFTLSHDTAPLTLDMIDMMDFGLRYAWRGAGLAEAAVLPAGRGDDNATHAPVSQDVLELVEVQPVRTHPLADDTRGGVLVVVDLDEARVEETGRAGAIGRAHGGPRGGQGALDGQVFRGGASDGPEAWDADVARRVCPWPSPSWAGLLPPV